MTSTSKDLIVAAVAGAAIMVLFASVDLVERLYTLTRAHEAWNLDEIVTGIPALAVVASWFAGRRWREAARLNRTLNEQAATLNEQAATLKEHVATRKEQAAALAEALAERRAMEKQLREGYKVAAMGTLGGGLATELRQALEPLRELADGGDASPAERDGWLERVAELVDAGLGVVDRMLAFGDGGVRETEAIVAADGVQEAITLAKEAIDPTLKVAFKADDETARIRVNRWELNEVAAQLVANAVDAMGTSRRLEVTVGQAPVGAHAAAAQGLAKGRYVRILVADSGPGIPLEIQGHIFEPFFTTKGAGDGRGLGLAIAYSLVRGWNGNLTLRSDPRRGAVLQLLIPIDT